MPLIVLSCLAWQHNEEPVRRHQDMMATRFSFQWSGENSCTVITNVGVLSLAKVMGRTVSSSES